MLFLVLFSLIQAKKTMCICYFTCSQSCLFDKLISNSSNYYFNNFQTFENEIELNLYSQENGFIVNIDLSYFNDVDLTLKTLYDSKNVKAKIKNISNSFEKLIDIKPNFKIKLRDIITLYSENNNNNNKISLLNDPSQTPIPISVPISHMTQKGDIKCEQKISCNYDNLNSPNAYNCGYRCWTYGETSFEYTFLGVKFAIYGTFDSKHSKFKVSIDQKQTIEIDEYSEKRQEFVLLYISEELEYEKHTIKISGNSTYEIYKLSYWLSMKAIRLNSTDLKKTGNWYKESDGIGGIREFTYGGGPTAFTQVQCSKIWVFGSKAKSHSDIIIQINDNETTISEYSDTRIDGVLLYESPDLDFDDYDLTIKTLGGSVLYCIYYLYDPIEQTPAPFPSISPSPEPSMTPEETPIETPIPTPIPISVGLTQMKINGDISCDPSNFDIYNIQNIGCNTVNLDSESAYKCGYRCWTNKATMEYQFKGVKFQLYGTVDPKLGKFNLIIDDETIEVDEFRNYRETRTLIYSSNELNYGYHNIKITPKGDTYEIYKLTYWPSMIAKRINITEMKKEGKWSKESDGIGGVREYSKGGSTITTELSFSKIWIYCSKMSWGSDLTLQFGEEEINISTYSKTREDGVLTFESQDYMYDTYNLTIRSYEQTILFNCIYYIDEPAIPTLSISATETPMPTLTATQSPDPTTTPNPTETPMATPTVSESPTPSLTPYPTLTPHPTPTPIPTPVPISIGLTQMNLNGRVYCNIVYFSEDNIQKLGCNINNLESESAYKCGYKCWNYGDANFSYTFKGVKFQLYGTYDPFHQKFNLTIDDEQPIEINEYNENRYEYVVIFESDELEYKEHTIQIIGIGETYELYKLAYWPEINAKRLNSTQLTKTLNWKKESDGIGGVREYTNSKNATASTTLLFTKFWLYSSTCKSHDEIILKIDSNEYIINLNSPKRVDSTLVFESDELDYRDHEIKLISNGTIMAYCIYYLNDPPPATSTPVPSRSPFYEDLESYIDKEFINYIYTDQIIVSPQSIIEQISGCSFINIIEDIDYLILLAKEIPFYDNTFRFDEYQYNSPSPIITRYNGHMTIYNCTFVNSKSRTNSGSVLTCHNDYAIDITVELCKFINCGNTTNDMIVQMMNKDSSINFINCIFSFDNETTSSKIICFQGLNINFENCGFHKCGSIYIDSQFDNNSFRFVNNIATSISQQLINYNGINSNQIISGNIFKNFIGANESFFYFYICQDEFELINNTFQSISFNNDENIGGIGLQLKFNETYLTTLFLNNCSFIENTNNNINNPYGGAFQFVHSSSHTNISIHTIGCIFKKNNCLHGYGGALSINIIGDIMIENCTFENNKAEFDGGAIYILGNSYNGNESETIEKQLVSINGCNFIDNKGENGNCIYLLENATNMNFEISSCIFETNDFNQQFNIQCTITNFYCNNISIIWNEFFNSNYFFILDYSESAEITDSKYINCNTENDSIINILNENKNIMTTMKDCEFIDCISKKSSIIIPEGKLDVQNCIFNFSDNKKACSGLEVISSTSININKCKFINNNNKILNAGSLYIHCDDSDSLENINIDNIIFDSCIGSSYRAINVELKNYKEDQLKISNIVIQNITTGSSIYGINVDTNILFDHWKFENNQFGNEYGNSYGSYLIPSQHISFNQCEWINNYCSDNGGAFGGALYNHINGEKISLLRLKSISFCICKFIQNSCAGNGGALFLDMTITNSVISIINCDFEMNKAFGDCGAIFIKHKDNILIDSCSFVNNSALKSISSNDPTDTLYINGNNYVLINNTNFTKGAYLNEITNYQFSHVNENGKNDFNITINFCMFSIINPAKNQVFVSEINNIGSFYISNSKFTHFLTQKKYFLSLNSDDENNQLLDKSTKSGYIHIYQNFNIPVHITKCCFDNDEILQISNLILISENNTLNEECFYPEIINELIIEIENYKYPTNIPTNLDPKKENNKNNKIKIIIGSVIGSVFFVIIVISIIVTIVLIKIKNNKSELSAKSYTIDEDLENELVQESNDSLCTRYEKSLSNIATYYITQDNPLCPRTIMTNEFMNESTSTSSSIDSSLNSSNSSSNSQSNSDFEESSYV